MAVTSSTTTSATTTTTSTNVPMRSTWRKNRDQWRIQHHVINYLDSCHKLAADNAYPVHSKSDPVPYLTEWSCHVFVLLHAAWPMLLHLGLVRLTGRSLGVVAMFALYSMGFRINALRQTRLLAKLAQRCGYLDADAHPRDDIPDNGIMKTIMSIAMTTSFRTLLSILFAYDQRQPPSLSWWLPVELALYSVVLDLWFYIYHRACHEIDALWQYHRTHHLTKHPVPLLSAFADTEQEVIEIAIVPLLTYASLRLMGLPMGFYDWWICHQYIVFTEALGHSGLRLYAVPPGTISWLLQLAKCELIVEDHDLHHRRGWKKSCNYGKQTRVWDRLFGTCGERLEVSTANVDSSMTLNMPLL